MTSSTSPTPRTPHDVLRQEQVVQAAIALLDEGGIDGLTMRRLGGLLGTTAAALYWHVKSRHDLLLLATDTVWSQAPLSAVDGLEWRQALLAMAGNLRSMLFRHPWLLVAMTMQPLDGAARDRHDEHLLAVCTSAGFTRRDAERAAQSVVTFAIGSALADTPDPNVSFGLRSLLDGIEARLSEASDSAGREGAADRAMVRATTRATVRSSGAGKAPPHRPAGH
ncbi:TetR family transcriptional regulator [Streptomyces sp. S3(2020)]|uniref:TetR/AcrR family transcriptional regulator C-terminal domain-containing protein n=1 Tax=Streptomyces sp. S3(2020) TaxID=2732044 RepID=UPI0014891F1B|nr:TetR/AcrR family transcriptional regulator C-terminal domain-containing protein [Streptomyces sp. S3(2020)]NNN29152.1 TetR family transcriptional regulator [Streptomyces sp. S3(2020)]